MDTERVARLLSERHLPSTPMARRDGGSNEVWIAPKHVVRIHRTGMPGRLEHEARVLARLPDEVSGPRVVEVGWAEGHDWMIAERVGGIGLGDAWPSLSERVRQQAMGELGQILRSLHATCPDGLIPPCLWLGKPVVPIGAMADDAIDALTTHDGGDRGILDSAASMVRDLGHLLGGVRDGLVHGDCYLNNILWADRVVAVLDFEFARAHPPDTDLVALVDSYAGQALSMLAAAYPELFAHPRLRERLLIYELCTRAATLRIPFSDEGALRRIGEIVRGESSIDRARW